MLTYTESQKKAIETIDGPVLIIAGPGTGKTFTIVERVCHMVANLDIDPKHIMISTFTNKAATELLDRLSTKFKEKGINKDVNHMLLGNFHGICRKILNQYMDYLDLNVDYQTIDDIQKKYLISKYIEEFRKIEGFMAVVATNQVNAIDQITKLVFEESFDERDASDPRFKTMLKIVEVYEKILKVHNYMDHSTILYNTYKLLVENPDIRSQLNSTIKYIMIDEYQDTNTIQEKIIGLILNEDENLCVVGDDDQGLYRFRGASIKNILHFGENLNKKVTRINLDTNYRSTADIVEFYSDYMGRLNSEIDNIEKFRYEKNLKAFDKKDYNSVYSLTSKDSDSYRRSIVNFIKALKVNGKISNYNEVAILVSSINHSEILKLNTLLRKSGIEVYTPTSKTLISRDETRYIIGALYGVFSQVIIKNNLRINTDTHNFLQNSYDLLIKKSDGIKGFLQTMGQYISGDDFSHIYMIDIVYRILRYQPFKDILENFEDSKQAKNLSRFIDILSTFDVIDKLPIITKVNLNIYIQKFFGDFIGFLQKENITEFEEDTQIPGENQVSLLTIHASKGMEYPVVIMASLWDKEFNNYRNNYTDLIDEFSAYIGKKEFEPNIFKNKLDFYRKYYTGFSRAENLLVLAGFNGPYGISQNFEKIVEDLEEISLDDFENIKTSKYKKSKLKAMYSYTQDIAPYTSCPRAYYYFRKLRMKQKQVQGMVYGSIVHQTIEYINRALIENRPINKIDIEDYINSLMIQKYRAGAVFLNTSIKEKIQAEINKYLKFISQIDRILGAEEGISISFEDFILTGNIDMIYQEKDKLGIMDFKTGKNPNERGNLDLFEKYLNQIKLYAYMFENTDGRMIDQVDLYFTSLDNEKDLYRQDVVGERFDEFIDSIRETIGQIENDRLYPKTKDILKCQACDMRFVCERNK